MAAIMPGMDLDVRAARRDDRTAAGLLYESAAPYYDAYAGSERRARRMLASVWPKPGHTASYEISRVAVLDGRVVGVLAGFLLRESDGLANRFIALSVRRLPPWRLVGVARHLRAAGRLTPHPPRDAFYVDGLAVAEEARRHGVARALLDAASATAAARGASGVALDTGLANRGARALYEAVGFERLEVRTAPDARTARAIGGEGFVSYFRAL
jgi:ribosomal protein S18 acetylase RimI-like enzyme